MDDRERIEALAADGRITREEADRLLGVLDDMDRTEEQLGGVDDQVRREGKYAGDAAPPLPLAGGESSSRASAAPGTAAPAAAGAPEAPAAPAPLTPAPPATAPAAEARARANSQARAGSKTSAGNEGTAGPKARGSEAPAGMQWLEVRLLAGDLKIAVDESADVPSASSSEGGELALDPIEDGFRVGAGRKEDGSILGRFLGGISRGTTSVRVPKGWGVRLEMKAGEVDIAGPLAFLAGHLLAGDLDADEVHGIDLSVSAGDVDVALLIEGGRNRLHAVAGDINVRLLAGSDSKVRGRVNIGDLSVPDGWARRNAGIGSSFEHTVGQGSGELSLELGTGDLKIRQRGERDASGTSDGR